MQLTFLKRPKMKMKRGKGKGKTPKRSQNTPREEKRPKLLE